VSRERGPLWRDHRQLRRKAESVLLILAALAMMALLVRDLIAGGHGEAGHDAARTIAAGYEHARAFDEADVEDDALAADEPDAGAMWAKVRRPQSPQDCPAYSPAFRQGCADYIARSVGREGR